MKYKYNTISGGDGVAGGEICITHHWLKNTTIMSIFWEIRSWTAYTSVKLPGSLLLPELRNQKTKKISCEFVKKFTGYFYTSFYQNVGGRPLRRTLRL